MLLVYMSMYSVYFIMHFVRGDRVLVIIPCILFVCQHLLISCEVLLINVAVGVGLYGHNSHGPSKLEDLSL